MSIRSDLAHCNDAVLRRALLRILDDVERTSRRLAAMEAEVADLRRRNEASAAQSREA